MVCFASYPIEMEPSYLHIQVTMAEANREFLMRRNNEILIQGEERRHAAMVEAQARRDTATMEEKLTIYRSIREQIVSSAVVLRDFRTVEGFTRFLGQDLSVEMLHEQLLNDASNNPSDEHMKVYKKLTEKISSLREEYLLLEVDISAINPAARNALTLVQQEFVQKEQDDDLHLYLYT